MKIKFFLFVAIMFAIKPSFSQNDYLSDSTLVELEEDDMIEVIEEESNLDPQRSALLSAILPGLGQVYNKQYWKVPIIVSGFIAFGHYINYNNQLYHAFRNAAIITGNGGENPYEGIVSSESSLIQNRDAFRRNRDYLIILGTAFYILQIVDAHVSAHLNEFDVNDDLAIRIEPTIQSSPLFSQAVGASIVLRF